jgi:hypothetical protein
MNSRAAYRPETRQNGPRIPEKLAPFLGIFVLAEIVIAVAAVVGFFLAISQPFGWQSGLQMVLFASMAILLWIADARVDVGDSGAPELSVAYAHRDLNRRETRSS